MENLETVTEMPTGGISQKERQIVTLLQRSHGMEVNVEDFWKSGIDYAETSFFSRTFHVLLEASEKRYLNTFQCFLSRHLSTAYGDCSSPWTLISCTWQGAPPPLCLIHTDLRIPVELVGKSQPRLMLQPRWGSRLTQNDSSIVPFCNRNRFI